MESSTNSLTNYQEKSEIKSNNLALTPEFQYWQKQLIPTPPVIDLPCDGFGRSDCRQSRQTWTLDSALRSKIRETCQQREISLENLLLTAFKILLHRYTDETTILIYGEKSILQLEHRHKPNIQSPHLNSLLLRTEVSSTQTGTEVCRSVQAMLLEAGLYGGHDFEAIVAQIEPDRNLATHPFSFIQFGIRADVPIQTSERDLDLDFMVVVGDRDWNIAVTFRSSLFLPETITRLMGHYECLLTGLLENPDTLVQDLPLITPTEREQLLTTWNHSEFATLPDRCIHTYIEEQVERTPDAIALIYTDLQGEIYQLTYQDLNSKANQLAHYLRSQGIQPQADQSTPIISVCVERTPEMVIAFLAILKAGAAYLPLDPLYPPERRIYKLKDCNTLFLITQESLATTIVPDDFTGMVLVIDRDWNQIAVHPTTNPVNLSTPDSLAYIIYTSGSTGNPKGVMIPHTGLTNHCFAMRDAFVLKANDRILQFSSMSFDIIIEELYPTLVTGAALVLRSAAISSSIDQFLSFVQTHQLTLLNIPTAFWHELVLGMSQLNRPLPPSVRLVVVGGEKASKNLYQKWCELVSSEVGWLNTYGPTETTVSATLYDPVAEAFSWHQPEIPIGRPLRNVTTYILDRQLNPVPVGVAGELYIGGAGLAQGYLNQPEKTADKFIPNPFGLKDSTDRIYNTGDVVRYRSNGVIEFVGRRDFQVKIRGFRIELGEIERALESHSEVQQAVVLAVESSPGNKKLAAYSVMRSDVSQEDLRSFLRTKLPDYMVPTYFTVMSVLPVTPNGKVDRKALPSPRTSSQTESLRENFQSPSNIIEHQLLEIWQNLLGVSNLSVTDNFFNMGGHSLLITRMIIEIESQFDVSMPVNLVFEAPTIREFAKFLTSEDLIRHRQKIVPFREQGNQLPIFCIPGARGNLLFAHSFLQHWGDRDHPIYGLQEPLDSDPMPLPTTIPEIADYYLQQVKTIQPSGPYHLVGYSIGGLIAYEMAQQLRSQGQEVDLLGLLDPAPPISAIKSRQFIQQIPTSNRLTLMLQLSLLQLISLQDFYVMRIQDMPKRKIVNYLIQEGKTWLQSGEAKKIWHRFRSLIGISTDIPTSITNGSNAPLSSSETPPNLSMGMKYDRSILYYLTQPYLGSVKYFCSEEWRQDVANWRGWEKWFAGTVERYDFSGSHMTFYQKNTTDLVDQLLPMEEDDVNNDRFESSGSLKR